MNSQSGKPSFGDEVQNMSFKNNYPEGYFDDLIAHYVHVECASWGHTFAEEKWGANYKEKTTIGEIRQERQQRQTGEPFFNIHFKDTKLITQSNWIWITF
jgi:hypothetical protein